MVSRNRPRVRPSGRPHRRAVVNPETAGGGGAQQGVGEAVGIHLAGVVREQRRRPLDAELRAQLRRAPQVHAESDLASHRPLALERRRILSRARQIQTRAGNESEPVRRSRRDPLQRSERGVAGTIDPRCRAGAERRRELCERFVELVLKERRGRRGASPADLAAVQQHGGEPRLDQMRGDEGAGDAAPEDDDVGLDMAIECGIDGGKAVAHLPEGVAGGQIHRAPSGPATRAGAPGPRSPPRPPRRAPLRTGSSSPAG